MTVMWCDRCGDLDQASLGSDEHGLDCGYVVLCEACRTNIADAQEDAREQAAPLPHLAQRDAGLPLTKARGWRRGGYRFGDLSGPEAVCEACGWRELSPVGPHPRRCRECQPDDTYPNGSALSKWRACGVRWITVSTVLIGQRVELIGLHRDGHEFPIEISIAHIVVRGVPCFSAYVRDISERKASEKKINRDYHTQRVLAELLETSMRATPFEQRLQLALELILSTPWLSLQGSGSIFLVDEEQPGRLRMVAKHGLPTSVAQTCATIDIGCCLCGRAAMDREVLFVDCVDHRHDIHYQGMTEALDGLCGVRSIRLGTGR